MTSYREYRKKKRIKKEKKKTEKYGGCVYRIVQADQMGYDSRFGET